ncbi:NIPSNAP family protein [Streptomyces sp. NPDC058291]|uniref:NIPSNAP family protein n=1 Tax=Streptomyces sp. NPDC058291 TaxID=3346427 RepID=UPI0036E148E9
MKIASRPARAEARNAQSGPGTDQTRKSVHVITCHLRYEIDPSQTVAFENYVTGWIPIVTRFGGTHHGCFLPHEGASDLAYALFSFPSLAAYEDYRAAIRQDPEAQQLWQLSTETRCIRRFDRTFLRPAMQPSGGLETS